MPRRLQALATVSWILLVAGAGALAQQPQTYVQQAGSGLAPSVATFSNLSIASGNVLCSNATVTYAGGQVTTLQNGVNYVYFDCGTSVPKSSTSPFTGDQIPLAVVVAQIGSYGASGLLDVRPWAVTRSGPALPVTDFRRGGERGPDANAAEPAADPAPGPTSYNVTTSGGTIGYLSYFDAGTPPSDIANSAVFYNSTTGNVGVGTATPLAPLTVGSASAVALDFGPISPNTFASLTSNSSHLSVNQPDFFMSRNDASSNPSCSIGYWFAPCESPMAVLEVQNTNGGSIPNVSALDIVAGGFNATDPYHNQPANSNFTFALGTRWEDTNTDNVTIGRAQNVIAVVRGNPTTPAAGGFTRTVAGIEIDVSNQSGNPAVPFGGSPPGGCSYGSTCGNVLGGMSIVQTYGPNATDAIAIGSSSNVSGAGFLHGLDISGISGDCAICLYKGGPSGGFSPTEAIHVETTGSYGVVVGTGTVTDTPSSGVTPGNPTTGILLDAQGTTGTSETQSSNSLVIRAKTSSSTGTDWTLTQSGADNMLDLKGPAVANSVNHSFVVGDSSSRRLELGYGGTSGIAGTTDNQAKIIWGQVGPYAGDLLIGSRGNYATNLIFYTSPGSGLERVRINSSGSVGIGTTTPALQLQVAKAMGAGVNPITTGTGSYTVDASLGNTQLITLGGSPSSGSFQTGTPVTGEPLAFEVCQASSGGPYTFVWPPHVLGATNAIPAAASACVQQGFVYDGSNAVALGPGTPVAVDLTAQGANISQTTLFTPAAKGVFRISIYIIVARAATTSSTMPSVTITWTDQDNATLQSLTPTSTSGGNSLTTLAQATVVISAGTTAAVKYSTSGYASSGGTSMQYALHIRAESM